MAVAMAPLRLALLIGSTREGRAGPTVGDWCVEVLGERDDIEVEVLDLLDFSFPARFPAEPTEEMCRFAGAIERAEGFVVVTPEYNAGYPAALKQAIDYAYDEWHAKPVGFVSYGLRTRGRLAVAALRCVFVELRTVTMRDEVGIDMSGPCGTPAQVGAASAMLDELVWWGLALREAKQRRSFVV
ncbi:NADPH-dependent FMN reductase [Streptomyces sp. NBRC 109706]|uniref:NADPH-dependent FMN reductase n=1 Tax=Streptomyces sp. NBRC 109706 TaxID=1550035 RepID=UPI0007846877|nr:NAD(P)H-dependent oxidoreductase [Streptomyces sp. NBRC 109706]